MSSRAIYEVTRALRMLLHSQLSVLVPNAEVTLLPPGDALPEISGVNLFLYQAVESPFTKNRPWPGDRSTRPSDQPALGLHLHYLLTPLGIRPQDANPTTGDDAHAMLGTAMLTLHEHPVVNDVHIPGFDADVVLPQFLRDSYEKVKVCLAPASLEELSKIWSTINRPYRLSVAYEVSLVELTPSVPPPGRAGIVLTTGPLLDASTGLPKGLQVLPIQPPRLAAVVHAVTNADTGALSRTVGAGLTPNLLNIQGFGFSFAGTLPVVHIAGEPVTLQTAPPPTDQTLTVVLPMDLKAGPQVDVEVILNARASSPLPFIVSPWLAVVRPLRTALEAGALLTLTGSGLLNAQSVRLDGPGGTRLIRGFRGARTDTAVSAPLPVGLANGMYLVRVLLADGSASNSRGLEVIPLLNTVTAAFVQTGAGSVHELTLSGARLNGADVRLSIDGGTYEVGPAANAAQLVFRMGRQLDPGAHTIAVNVDGHLSHSVVLQA